MKAFWEDDLENQNLLLRVAVSDAIRDTLAGHDFSRRIESEETLANLPSPLDAP